MTGRIPDHDELKLRIERGSGDAYDSRQRLTHAVFDSAIHESGLSAATTPNSKGASK